MNDEPKVFGPSFLSFVARFLFAPVALNRVFQISVNNRVVVRGDGFGGVGGR